MFNQEYVAAQARDEKGFVIVQSTKVADELKPFMTEIENYKGEIKNSGIKLNVDFHNTMNALKNYIADNNLKNAQEFDEIIGNIQAEVENGTFASKAKPSNYQGTKATPRATKETSSQKTSDFKPLLNEQGYVVVFKPKNETQAQISELFNIYFNENLKGKNFPKDLINDFNSSRNFHTGQESSKEAIDKFFAGFDKRVDYFEKAANKTPSLDEVLDLLKNLTKDVASIKKALNIKDGQRISPASKMTGLDELDYKEKASIAKATKTEWIAENKSLNEQGLAKYGSEDYSALSALVNQGFKDKVSFENAIKNLQAQINERELKPYVPYVPKETGQARENVGKSNTASKSFNPEDDSALKEIRSEENKYSAASRRSFANRQTNQFRR